MRHVGRRQFLISAGTLLAAPRIAWGQTGKRPLVLGILSPGTSVSARDNRSRLLGRLRELGWSEGQSLRVESAYADDQVDRVPTLAAALVAKNVDVIWTGSPIGAVAAARATSTIPIVFWRVGFPVEYGLIDSFARPGRNATGTSWTDPETVGKRIQLMREIVPGARRMAGVAAPRSDWQTVSGSQQDWGPYRATVEAAMRHFGFEGLSVYVGNAADVDKVAAQIAQWGADCLGVADVPQTIGARSEIIDMARRLRLPAVYQAQDWVLAGGLFSYGIVLLPTLLRTAEMVDRILRGAKPAEIPVEMPRDYELTVNLKTAMALGIKIPQSVLLRADRVIE